MISKTKWKRLFSIRKEDNATLNNARPMVWEIR